MLHKTECVQAIQLYTKTLGFVNLLNLGVDTTMDVMMIDYVKRNLLVPEMFIKKIMTFLQIVEVKILQYHIMHRKRWHCYKI